MKVIMKSIFILLLAILFTCPHMLSAQNTNKAEWKKELDAISEHYVNGSFYMNVVYMQKREGQPDFEKIDQCEMALKNGWQHVFFKNYETLLNENYFFKADHQRGIIYVLEVNDADEGSENIPWAFDEKIMSTYHLQYDDQGSNLEEGKIILKGLPESSYRSIEYSYDPINKDMKNYLINFRPELTNGMEAYQISIESLNELREHKTLLFKQEQYISLDSGEMFKLTEKYKTYQLVKNF